MKKSYVLWIILIIPYLLLIGGFFLHKNEIGKIPESRFVIVNKNDFTLSLYNFKGKLQKQYKIGTGINAGDKKEEGDSKTPEGLFEIIDIQNSSSWEYDFEGDSLPAIQGAYGPWFIRLDANGFKGIGIHGTHDNGSLGERSSHGCIRMNNDDLEDFKNRITKNTVVAIIPGKEDLK